MPDPNRGTERAGRRAKRFLTPLQKYEIWLQLVRQEVTIAEAAERWEVDRATVARKRTRVNDLISYLLTEGAELVAPKKWSRRDERRLAAARAKGEAHARELNPVTIEGGLARHGVQLSPGIRQYRRILQRATRLGRRGSKSE